jgi:phage gp36-like protein
MAYATIADATSAVGADLLLTVADHNSDGTLETASVTTALADASSLADTYLTAHLPLSTVPAILTRHVVSIAVYLLAVPRNQSTEDIRRAYKDALDWLKDVAAGTASLGPDDDSEDDPGSPLMEAADREWTRDTTRCLL